MCTARNGDIRLAYDVEGEGSDLLLIAGTASTRALWLLVRPELARSYRTIAFDNRDSGSSSLAVAPYAIADLAADAVAVLDAAGSREAHVLGHSLGGAVAQELALNHPLRCRSLTIACSWARGDLYSHNGIKLMRALTNSVADDRTLLASILWAGAGVTTLSAVDLWEKTDAALALGALAPREALTRQWQAALAADTLDRLTELRVPSHIIWASEDRLLPQPLSRRLLDAIPHATQTRIDGCGHLPMIDAAGKFISATLGFLSTA